MEMVGGGCWIFQHNVLTKSLCSVLCVVWVMSAEQQGEPAREEENMEEYIRQRMREITAEWKKPIMDYLREDGGDNRGMVPIRLIRVSVGSGGYEILYWAVDGFAYRFVCDESGDYEDPGECEIERL